ncbi:LURP-one-related/scramblase family protein [Cryptosporangium minutisporangium]|uniref:LURP-one-related/scramblase family protein n=1 Tax=Cryptosporangium minutisporangium TaxID=113569 RepID=A0ABP6SYY1_9ACTN
MGLGDRRARRREERETFGRGGSARRYQLRQKLISIGDDYWVEDEDGERAFHVDGKALRLRKTFHLEDLEGRRLCTIQKRVMHIRDTMEIEGPEGGRIALVHKAMISPLRDRWKVEVENGPDLEAHGSIADHEYEIEADGRKVANVSKRWFRVRDTYGVEIAPDQDAVLLLAVTVAIDEMAHGGK